MDKLEQMFEWQKMFQKRLKSDVTSQEFRNTMTLAAQVELSEFIMWTPWKPWKKKQELNKEEALLELVDVQHFLINLVLSLGVDYDEFFAAFEKKMAENHARQDRGY